MQSRNGGFEFGPKYNFGTETPLVYDNDVDNIPIVTNAFLLLDGTRFKLLDGTNFLLLGS